MKKLIITESQRNKISRKRGTINTLLIKKNTNKTTVVLVS
jgi:hypothetical protein